jgi:hypothetical protein
MIPLRKISRLLIALSLLGMSACAGGAAGTATVDTAPIYTQIASTALALQTQTVLARPSPTNTPVVSPTLEASATHQTSDTAAANTDTPQPGAPTSTLVSLKTPLATSQAACDNMEFVTDVTIQDGYSAAPGELMLKTWRVKNLGPCVWDQDYALAFGYGGDGTNWSETQPVNLTSVVNPGETVDITVSLEAPSKTGEYGAFFRLRNDKGFYFGPYIYISIKV